MKWRASRLCDAPIVDKHSDPSIGENIQGPSAIRVPDWVTDRLGKYYLYFADHKGRYIRLAYSDRIEGPWTIHAPGTLQLRQSRFPTIPPSPTGQIDHSIQFDALPHSLHKERSTPHIASPDVHVDHEAKRIVMYFHGLEAYGYQATRMGVSNNGLNFEVLPEIICPSYLRTFVYQGQLYGMTMPGQTWRSTSGPTVFEKGKRLFNPNMRHFALLVRGDFLDVFWTQVGDVPERILVSTIDVSKPFDQWTESNSYELLRPERDWEGSDQPLEPSIRSVAYGLVNQLRDPAILVDEGRVFLFYAVGGESGIGVVELARDPSSMS